MENDREGEESEAGVSRGEGRKMRIAKAKERKVERKYIATRRVSSTAS